MKWRVVLATIKRELVFYKMLVAHQETPRIAKILLGLAVAYLLSPIDLIPDFIPVLGHLDDVLIVPGLIWLALLLIPQPLEIEGREKCGLQDAHTDVH